MIEAGSRNRVACPASFPGETHFAKASQIARWGVCRKCRARIKKDGKAILAGKVEQPVDMNERPHHLDIEQDHAAFDASGVVVQTTHFDFDEVDRALGLVEIAPIEARQQAAELVRELFVWCFKSNKRHAPLRTASARFAVIAAGLRPDLLSDDSQTELAQRLGMTKAALSKASVRFQDAFGIKFSRSRSLSARASMRARRLGGPARYRKTKPKRRPAEAGYHPHPSMKATRLPRPTS
jgi:hypothetical protein